MTASQTGEGDAASALSFLDDLHAETIVELRRRYGGSDGIPAKAMYQGWGKREPTGAVIHVPGYGAGHRTLDGWDLACRFTRKGALVSAHLVINWPDGSILCPVSVRNRAWHARGMNNAYFGVGVVSPGPITPAGSNRWLDGQGNGHVLRPDRSPLHPGDVADFGPERSTLPYGYRYWHMFNCGSSLPLPHLLCFHDLLVMTSLKP